MRRRYLRAVLVLTAAASSVSAQGTVHSVVLWGGLFGDHRFGTKSSLYWDYMPRRANAGATWQLNLGAVGYTRDLSAHWRATAALGWAVGYRYGAFPARSNNVELRPWVQINGSRPLGSWAWTDRTRAEFRVVRPIGEFAPVDADWAPTVVRLRRQDRFQHALTVDKRWYGAAVQEFLVNVLPEKSRNAMLEQMRTQFVLGHLLTPKNRVEVGYGLQYINRRGGQELNHALLLFYRTAIPLR